jgi:hypothetical protein
MRKVSGILMGVVVSFGLLMPVLAADTCPSDGKVEGGNLNGIVLDAGTQVCIKGGQKLVTVTADGMSTLQVLLDARNANGQLQDVSHYTVLEDPSDTTTTSLTSSTTTTEPPSTSTTTIPATTSLPPATTSTSAGTGTVPTSSSTIPDIPRIIPDDQIGTPVSYEALPYTGAADWLAHLASALVLVGSLLVVAFKGRTDA